MGGEGRDSAGVARDGEPACAPQCSLPLTRGERESAGPAPEPRELAPGA